MQGDTLAEPDAALPVVDCAGVPITACGRVTAAEAVVDLAAAAGPPPAGGRHRSGVDVHLCNAYTLATADADDGLRDLLGQAGRNFPDGKSVVWANRLRHRDLDLPTERVYGPNLFKDVLDRGQERDLRHFLLGATPEVLAELERRLRRDYPKARIVGADSPPFRPLEPEERAALRERIAASGAQVVWVGLGTPKQDWEAARLAHELPVVTVAIGAAFDFVAGSVRQAPGWLGELGLEWLFRLACEPRRLWRRYLFGNVRFLWAALAASRRRR